MWWMFDAYHHINSWQNGWIPFDVQWAMSTQCIKFIKNKNASHSKLPLTVEASVYHVSNQFTKIEEKKNKRFDTRFTNGDDDNNWTQQKCVYVNMLRMIIMIIIEHWTHNVIDVSCIRIQTECFFFFGLIS